MTEKFNIWEGIYSSFQDADPDVVGAGFKGEAYRARAIHFTNECSNALKMGIPIPGVHKLRNALLPPVAAMMLWGVDKLRVLDFGGGLGIGYMVLVESIPRHAECLHYTIVEVPEVCQVGREVFAGQKELTFLDSMPSKGKYDLLYSVSALQYNEDWRQVLRSLSECGAQYILLSDVFAGSIPSFVTLQNYYGSRIRQWFLNLDELLAFIPSIGYRLVMKSFVNTRRLGAEDILPMDNFPESHRLASTLHLLLYRES